MGEVTRFSWSGLSQHQYSCQDFCLGGVMDNLGVQYYANFSLPLFLGLSVLELGQMYVTDRRQTKASLNASALWGPRHKQ